MTSAMPWDGTDIVIAIDPGLVTGYCTWTTGSKSIVPEDSGQLGWTEFETWLELKLGGYAYARKNVWVQSEMFSITARTARTAVMYESVYVNGTTQFLCRKFGFGHGFSKPEQVMRLFSDAALRALGWHRPGMGHHNDAARHLGLVLLQRGIITSKDMKKGLPKPQTRIK